ncbi:MAG: hypothetical protein DSY37_02770 [Hyperthermus sp.]|nr:MAG: hypothetical protein DSY37_02770 [Hyperthermus sp.]
MSVSEGFEAYSSPLGSSGDGDGAIAGIDMAVFYASVASALRSLGFDNSEVMERYYDAVCSLGEFLAPAVARELAYYSSLKERDGTAIVDLLGEDYFRSILSFIVHGSCREVDPWEVLADIAAAVGLRREAWEAIAEAVAGRDCETIRYAMWLILATPPNAPGETGHA